MSLEDKYVNANLVAGKKAKPALSSMDDSRGFIKQFEIAAADNANSIYRFLKAVPGEMILSELLLSFDAFGAGGLLNVGIYESKVGGATYDDNAFASGVDVSAAAAKQNGLAAIDLADREKRLFELAGHDSDTKKEYYDLGIKITAKGATGLGTVLAQGTFLQG